MKRGASNKRITRSTSFSTEYELPMQLGIRTTELLFLIEDGTRIKILLRESS